MQVQKSVFISYRRTNRYHAIAVYQYLLAEGYDVFLDTENVDSGSFEQIILRQIDARAHFVVILTPSALERCDDADDWLRREIERAIDQRRNIVPLMFDAFDFRNVKQYLTGKLVSLDQYNGIDVPHNYFEEAMHRLCTRFLNKPRETILHPTPAADQAEVQRRQAVARAEPKPTTDQLSAEQYFEQGMAHIKLEEYEAAIADLSGMLRINPNHVEAYRNRGWAFSKLENHEAAIADYLEWVRLKPKDKYAWDTLIRARDANRDYAGMVMDATNWLAISPQNLRAYKQRGMAQYWQGNHAAAETDYTEALRLNPLEADTYLWRGNARAEQEKFVAAIADYTEAIRLGDASMYTYKWRGNARVKQGDYEGAVADFREVLRIEPSDFGTRMDLYNVLKMVGNFAAIAANCTEALRIFSQDDVRRYFLVWRGEAYTALEDYERAITDFSETKDIRAYMLRGNVREAQGDYEQALANYSLALEIYPSHEDARESRRRVREKLGDYQGMIADLSAEILHPSYQKNADLYIQRGDLLAQHNDYKGAVADYETALHIEPDNELAKEKLAATKLHLPRGLFGRRYRR